MARIIKYAGGGATDPDKDLVKNPFGLADGLYRSNDKAKHRYGFYKGTQHFYDEEKKEYRAVSSLAADRQERYNKAMDKYGIGKDGKPITFSGTTGPFVSHQDEAWNAYLKKLQDAEAAANAGTPAGTAPGTTGTTGTPAGANAGNTASLGTAAPGATAGPAKAFNRNEYLDGLEASLRNKLNLVPEARNKRKFDEQITTLMTTLRGYGEGQDPRAFFNNERVGEEKVFDKTGTYGLRDREFDADNVINRTFARDKWRQSNILSWADEYNTSLNTPAPTTGNAAAPVSTNASLNGLQAKLVTAPDTKIDTTVATEPDPKKDPKLPEAKSQEELDAEAKQAEILKQQKLAADQLAAQQAQVAAKQSEIDNFSKAGGRGAQFIDALFRGTKHKDAENNMYGFDFDTFVIDGGNNKDPNRGSQLYNYEIFKNNGANIFTGPDGSHSRFNYFQNDGNNIDVTKLRVAKGGRTYPLAGLAGIVHLTTEGAMKTDENGIPIFRDGHNQASLDAFNQALRERAYKEMSDKLWGTFNISGYTPTVKKSIGGIIDKFKEGGNIPKLQAGNNVPERGITDRMSDFADNISYLRENKDMLLHNGLITPEDYNDIDVMMLDGVTNGVSTAAPLVGLIGGPMGAMIGKGIGMTAGAVGSSAAAYYRLNNLSKMRKIMEQSPYWTNNENPSINVEDALSGATMATGSQAALDFGSNVLLPGIGGAGSLSKVTKFMKIAEMAKKTKNAARATTLGAKVSALSSSVGNASSKAYKFKTGAMRGVGYGVRYGFPALAIKEGVENAVSGSAGRLRTMDTTDPNYVSVANGSVGGVSTLTQLGGVGFGKMENYLTGANKLRRYENAASDGLNEAANKVAKKLSITKKKGQLVMPSQDDAELAKRLKILEEESNPVTYNPSRFFWKDKVKIDGVNPRNVREVIDRRYGPGMFETAEETAKRKAKEAAKLPTGSQPRPRRTSTPQPVPVQAKGGIIKASNGTKAAYKNAVGVDHYGKNGGNSTTKKNFDPLFTGVDLFKIANALAFKNERPVMGGYLDDVTLKKNPINGVGHLNRTNQLNQMGSQMRDVGNLVANNVNLAPNYLQAQQQQLQASNQIANQDSQLVSTQLAQQNELDMKQQMLDNEVSAKNQEIMQRNAQSIVTMNNTERANRHKVIDDVANEFISRQRAKKEEARRIEKIHSLYDNETKKLELNKTYEPQFEKSLRDDLHSYIQTKGGDALTRWANQDLYKKYFDDKGVLVNQDGLLSEIMLNDRAFVETQVNGNATKLKREEMNNELRKLSLNSALNSYGYQ